MNRAWYLVISIALTVAIGYVVYRSVPDWGEAASVTAEGRPLWLLAGLGCVALHMTMRAARWGVLLRPVKAGISMKTLFSLTLVKYVINVVPPRVGEVAASVALARKENVSAVSVIAASIFERVLDTLAALALFGLYLLFFAQRYLPVSPRGKEIFLAARNYAMAGLLVLALGFAVLLLLLGSRGWHGWMPEAVRRVVLSFMEGFRALHSVAAVIQVVILSLAIWLLISGQLWILTRAYLDDFPFAGSLLIMAMTVIGVAIPTPGGVGGFQFFMNLTLVHFFSRYLSQQDPNSQAAGISNGVFLVSMVPLILVGLLFLYREGLSFGRLMQMKEPSQV